MGSSQWFLFCNNSFQQTEFKNKAIHEIRKSVFFSVWRSNFHCYPFARNFMNVENWKTFIKNNCYWNIIKLWRKKNSMWFFTGTFLCSHITRRYLKLLTKWASRLAGLANFVAVITYLIVRRLTRLVIFYLNITKVIFNFQKVPLKCL